MKNEKGNPETPTNPIRPLKELYKEAVKISNKEEEGEEENGKDLNKS